MVLKISEEEKKRISEMHKMAIKKNLITEEYIDMVSDAQSKYFETLVDGKLVTHNAITFKNGIQFIIAGNTKMRSEFDFIHCMPYYDCSTFKYHISKSQFDSLRTKTIVMNPKYILRSASILNKRIEKYKNRGWKIN